MPLRKICFVTGTRAEFGLMQTTLRALETHAAVELQLVATGMHLSAKHGRTIDDIASAGFAIDAAVPWRDVTRNEATGQAIADLSRTFAKLSPNIVLVVGDRVEAFAAATAAHLGDIPLAHVHGGDRATGQADDSLRHAITKLAHVHLPATPTSRDRLLKLGEDDWRVHLVGAPGIDGIEEQAAASAEVTSPFLL
ncbi:MAG: UDP-N-acetylglucosamine 2-epimerase, partial [Planctomycetota bacterium]